MIKLVPQLEQAVTGPPGGLPEWPRLCCIIFVKDKDDPAAMERVRVHSWRAPNLQEAFSDLDKGYSRAAAKHVIPLLVSEINGLREPEEAVRKFHLMVGGPDIVRPFLDILGMGGTDNDDGELLGRYLEQLLGDEENRVVESQDVRASFPHVSSV